MLTVAQFMELALYDAELGYYATRSRRSGASGDFFTSVDLGPQFGEVITVQLAEMWAMLRTAGASHFNLVEVGAGDGRLARDILDTAAREFPELYERISVTLVERSAAARRAQRETLAHHTRLRLDIRDDLPSSIDGVVVANELFDAFPIHVLTMTADGPREIYVDQRDHTFVEVEGPVSDPSLLEAPGMPAGIAVGERVEINTGVRRWMEGLSMALRRGFVLCFDYGHRDAQLHGGGRGTGTLLAYRRHVAGAILRGVELGRTDLTAHVNLTTVQSAAESAGFTPLGCVDQTYFLIALGILDRLGDASDAAAAKRRLAAKTLVMPGGLGSTIKALAFGKNVGQASLRGFTRGRLT
jgi:SAM-dependent MidA family methyltransferase